MRSLYPRMCVVEVTGYGSNDIVPAYINGAVHMEVGNLGSFAPQVVVGRNDAQRDGHVGSPTGRREWHARSMGGPAEGKADFIDEHCDDFTPLKV